MGNRTGFELPVGIVTTYIIVRLWWNGWFQSMGIELFAPHLPGLLTADGTLLTSSEVYQNSVFGTLFIELINVMVGVGTVAIWAGTGLWKVLCDLLMGAAQGVSYVENTVQPKLPTWGSLTSGFTLPWKRSTPPAIPVESHAAPEAQPVDDRTAYANAMLAAAIAGDKESLVKNAQLLNGSDFMKPQATPRPATSRKRAPAKRTAK